MWLSLSPHGSRHVDSVYMRSVSAIMFLCEIICIVHYWDSVSCFYPYA